MSPYSHEVLHPLIFVLNDVFLRVMLLQQPESTTKISYSFTHSDTTTKIFYSFTHSDTACTQICKTMNRNAKKAPKDLYPLP